VRDVRRQQARGTGGVPNEIGEVVDLQSCLLESPLERQGRQIGIRMAGTGSFVACGEVPAEVPRRDPEAGRQDAARTRKGYPESSLHYVQEFGAGQRGTGQRGTHAQDPERPRIAPESRRGKTSRAHGANRVDHWGSTALGYTGQFRSAEAM